mgnify:CR=1 FL=1
MKIKSAGLLESAAGANQFPDLVMPEIAFAGRSNVGKSTLINSLLTRKKLVKTSSTPGKTRLINFFLINEIFCLVDLPGYGFAKVPAEMRESWRKLIETYLSRRDNLRGVVLIIDIRHGPTAQDRQFTQSREPVQRVVGRVLKQAGNREALAAAQIDRGFRATGRQRRDRQTVDRHCAGGGQFADLCQDLDRNLAVLKHDGNEPQADAELFENNRQVAVFVADRDREFAADQKIGFIAGLRGQVRFGQQGAKTKPPRKGESAADKAKRASFKARHAKNIAKGKTSAAYWANRVKWS